MKKKDWFVLIIVLIILISIGIIVYKSQKEEDTLSDGVDNFKNKLEEFRVNLDKKINSPELTQEVKVFLDQKIARYFLLAKSVFIALVIALYSLFVVNDYGWLNSFYATTSLVGLLIVIIPFIMSSKVVDPNKLIEDFHNKIRDWQYNNYRIESKL